MLGVILRTVCMIRVIGTEQLRCGRHLTEIGNLMLIHRVVQVEVRQRTNNRRKRLILANTKCIIACQHQ